MPGFVPRNVPPIAGAGVGTDSVTIVPAGKPGAPLFIDTGIIGAEAPELQPQPEVETGIMAEPVLPQPQPPTWLMPPSSTGLAPQASQSLLRPKPKCFLWNIPRPNARSSSQGLRSPQLEQPVRLLNKTAKAATESSIFMIEHSIPTKRRDHPRRRGWFQAGQSGQISFRSRIALTGVAKLYLTASDVQPPHENFLQRLLFFGNTPPFLVLKFTSDSDLHGCERLSVD
jgi:hypothetical protein